MASPTVVFVPGLWEGPKVFDPLLAILSSNGITDTHVAPLLSTGTTSPGNPSMLDDTAGVRAVIEPLVKQGKRVSVVAHSAGGLVAAGATKDLETTSSNEPGVTGFFFITAGVLPKGALHSTPPFVVIEGDKALCKDPDRTLWNGVPADVKAKYEASFSHQPAEGWSGHAEHAGWEHVPSTYLVCTEDALIPEKMQEKFAIMVKAKIERVPLGHLPFLADPQQVADKIMAWLKE